MSGQPRPKSLVPVRRRILYGRRKGRPLRPARRRLLRELLPRLKVSLSASNSARAGSLTGDGPLVAPTRFFEGPSPFADGVGAGPYREVWLEVGFGAGEHLLGQAEAHPEIAFVGCEPFVNGVAALLARVDQARLCNIRIYDDDARILIDRLADASLGRVFVLFPDPWPKTRHAGRRFIAADTLDCLARTMADGAELRVATDDPTYLRWALAELCRHDAFAWCAETAADWRCRPGDQPPTRYEEKARSKGLSPVFLTFRRRPRNGAARDSRGQNT